jgi:predicted DNA repair protein MutK
MPSGLVALLDDVAAIARAAAASMDDVAAGVAKAGAKAAGVVIDDAAVTPAYAEGFTPDRELPLIWKITKGSLRNKLLILLPAALFLSAFLPWAITPLLMIGGLFLAFEGAEKVIEALGAAHEPDVLEPEHATLPAGENAAEFENERAAGAVRTDLILSAEIMAIALAEVSAMPVVEQAAVLALVGVAITLAVYGTVGLIVKLDDIGLHLARKGGRVAQAIGKGLLIGTPKLLTALSRIGTLAMLWVGGGILLHGTDKLGWHGPSAVEHAIEHALAAATGPLGGVLGWLAYAAFSAVIGMAAGGVVAGVLHLVPKKK